ncbi:MAG: 30S ribosomal protein S16 [Cryobacterium sp.]|nr:30S ribosomal protein S16 [Oligoflexia bacterium]
MAVKIRLSRHGSKKLPLYFIVATDSASCRDGAFLEKLGQYRPKAEKPSDKLTINRDALLVWMSRGAQPTRTVGQLLKIK